MGQTNRGSGTVYTETVVFSAPEQYVNDAPYQLAIVDLDDGGRLTARILPESGRVQIGDRVVFAETRSGVAFYARQ
ncbi:MAG: OB-fold domain-containing protein [Bryobacteraceae bacterium]